MATLESIDQLRDVVTDAIAARRRMLRLVGSVRFQIAYSKTAEKAVVDTLIKTGNQDGLENWLDKDEGYNSMTIRKLRELGRQYGVPYYAQISRTNLIAEISAHEKATNRGNNRPAQHDEGVNPQSQG